MNDAPETTRTYAHRTDSEPATLDCRAIIRRFGGPMNLYRRLVRRGHSISAKTIEKWRERNRIQSPWLAEMILMAQEDGHPLNLIDYIERPYTPAGGAEGENQESLELEGAQEEDEEDEDWGLI